MTCECDYDFGGDPGRYFRSNHQTLCPVHDKCEVCDDALAVMITDAHGESTGTKVCATCAVEEIMVCPNCGWDSGFDYHRSMGEQPSGEGFDHEWLTCNHCGKRTDQEEVDRINKERLEEIKRRLEALEVTK